MNKLKREYQFFKQQTSNVRVLLMTNLLYAFVLPVVEIFVGAYVMRHTSEPVSVAFYQLFMYIGIIATSFVNGFLLRHVSVKVLYAGGILVSGLSMFAMMLVKSLGFVELGIAGFVLGAAFFQLLFDGGRDTLKRCPDARLLCAASHQLTRGAVA